MGTVLAEITCGSWMYMFFAYQGTEAAHIVVVVTLFSATCSCSCVAVRIRLSGFDALVLAASFPLWMARIFAAAPLLAAIQRLIIRKIERSSQVSWLQ
ncbi:hypothetical protein BT63DRAFT_427862 [Microthyrium microscopicum]|uniref:Uncharacterized protein n=1 Tax=Microthyrium microscopicum TaxID=703497 RepID=A0A6A6U180_9PEZI|nr:hypothetical protein BT63DRAFT_427862 [Microthyrium microscopicum]